MSKKKKISIFKSYFVTEGHYNNEITPHGGMTIFVGLFVMAIILAATAANISSHFNAYASEDANQECINRGYDTYTDYERPFLSKDAMGVKCGMIDYNRKQIDIDTTNKQSGQVQPVVVVN